MSPLFLQLVVAELAQSIPVTNAWPERGGSAIKRIKTTLRNRLADKMLDSLLHLSINAPLPGSDEASAIIQGPVVQNPINANPRLKINQGVCFSTPKCCSTLIISKTLH